MAILLYKRSKKGCSTVTFLTVLQMPLQSGVCDLSLTCHKDFPQLYDPEVNSNFRTDQLPREGMCWIFCHQLVSGVNAGLWCRFLLGPEWNAEESVVRVVLCGSAATGENHVAVALWDPAEDQPVRKFTFPEVVISSLSFFFLYGNNLIILRCAKSLPSAVMIQSQLSHSVIRKHAYI